MEATVNKYVTIASGEGERPEASVLESKTHESIKSEMIKKQEQMKSLQNANLEDDEEEDIEELELKHDAACLEFDVAEAKAKRAQKLHGGLKERLRQRLEKYRQYRSVWRPGW